MPLETSLFALPCVAAILAAEPAMTAAATSSPEAALEAYVDGLRTGQVERLQALFLPDGQFCTLAKGERSPVHCKRFAEVSAAGRRGLTPRRTGVSSTAVTRPRQ